MSFRRLWNEAKVVLDFIWNHPANRGKRVRKLMQAAAFQARGRLLKKPTVARLGDRSRLLAQLHVYNSSRALYANPPDWPEMLVWKNHLKPGDLFIDAGANVGAYTIYACELGAEVIAIEPDPTAMDRLLANLKLNDYSAETLPIALAEEAGIMKITAGLDMSNHLILAEEPGVPIREVEVRTVDELLGQRTASGLKIDVEGAELLVLSGATRALQEQRIRLLQLEWNECSAILLGKDRSPVAELMRSYGYELLRPDDSGILRAADVTGYGRDVFARPISG